MNGQNIIIFKKYTSKLRTNISGNITRIRKYQVSLFGIADSELLFDLNNL